MKRVVGVIPARWHSSRFPGKPLVEILGKSLLQRTYENARQSSSLTDLIVATDDARIFKHAESFGAQAYMTSPQCATGTDRSWQAIEHSFLDAEIIVNIQGDEPCLDPEVIDLLVIKLTDNPDMVMTTPVSPIADIQLALMSNVVKCVFDCHGRALYFSRSPIPFAHQPDQIPSYYRHIGVYCFRRNALRQYVNLRKTPLQECEDLEQLKMLENGLPIHVCMVGDQAAGVDTPADLKRVEQLLWEKENIYSSPVA
jgi:3-deoxy-manno-octulosonate cytidylyltransferase (CMP-KDO synthetase)